MVSSIAECLKGGGSPVGSGGSPSPMGRRLPFFPHLSTLPGGGGISTGFASEEREPLFSAESGRISGGGGRPGGQPFYHRSVMADEVVHFLTPAAGEIYVDGTLGGGGHSERILDEGASVLGLDRDAEAIAYAKERLFAHGDRFAAIQSDFRNLCQILEGAGLDGVDGILVDLGVSSHQLDAEERGFSFQHDGPLDMRMDRDQAVSAMDLVNELDPEQLADIFWRYGEERASRKLATAIAKARTQAKIQTTGQLAALIESIKRRTGRQHPATKVFQALRIAVNDELGAVEALLEQSVTCLKPGGRLVVITFHSLEDRIVKTFLRERSLEHIDRPEWPAPRKNPDHHFKLVVRKALAPSEEEVKDNPRARSAKLRVAERI